MDWRDDAACYAPSYNGFTERAPDEQRLVCMEFCPVRTDCLMAALDEELIHGRPGDDWPVRGGLTGAERARLLSGKPRPPGPIRHGTLAGVKAHERRGQRPCESCAQARRVAEAERRTA